MPHFMNIGGLVVNLDRVNFVVASPKEPGRLEIHFGNEVANIDKMSVEEMTTILNAIDTTKMPYNRPPPMP
jgi:hypothetical protein